MLEDCYSLADVVGKGAFGVVRAGKDKRGSEKIACKSISKAKLVCKEDVEDVRTEVAIMNHVAGHINVVTLRSTHEDANCVHLVMELCEGGELFDSVVDGGAYSEKKAANTFRKMVDVVRHCHELGVMHRDLKPENFLLTNKQADAELKLTDFGLGVFFKHGEGFRDVVGSPYYVAPEVLRKNYSHQADMWSLGVILYILLSGLPPFWGDTEEQIFKMALKGHLDFETDPWPKLSDASKDCVRKLLELDPARRATAADILHHPWLKMEGFVEDVPIDSVVLQRIRGFAAMNRMKKMALMVVGQNLSPEEIKGLKELFKAIDVDNSGTITVDELKNAIQKWGHKIKMDEIQKIIEIADIDGNGVIDYNEFVAATMHLSKLEKEEVVQKAFLDFDKDGNGCITEDELREVLDHLGISDDVHALIQEADKNHDGSIDYQEFLALMRTNDCNDGEGVSLGQALRRLNFTPDP
eukprot:evm.model.scf_2513EXC.1 EVM.evm.TU.scf_2513EXC.1   scf_2513EXC:242-4351(+)